MAKREHHVLVVGAGSIGERHLRCFLNTGRSDVSFVEVREDLRQSIAQRYPASTPFSSIEAALNSEVQSHNPIDSAVIATPAPLHIEQASLLVQSGLHVLIEKPLSLNLDGVSELSELAESTGKTVAVAYVHRANPILQQMLKALNSGQYGKPVELIVVTGQHFPTYRPAYRQTYYRSRETGGGAIQDALTHMINAGQWLAGNVERVVADAGHLLLEDVDVEDTVHLLARHGDVLASYSLNQHQAPNELTVTVNCEKGTLRFEGHKQRWRSIEKPDTPWKDHADFSFERDTLFERLADSFLDAIEGKGPVLCSLSEGVSSMNVNLAILRSLETGAWETVAD